MSVVTWQKQPDYNIHIPRPGITFHIWIQDIKCPERGRGRWNTYCRGPGRPGRLGRDRPESLYWSRSPSPPEKGVRERRRKKRCNDSVFSKVAPNTYLSADAVVLRSGCVKIHEIVYIDNFKMTLLLIRSPGKWLKYSKIEGISRGEGATGNSSFKGMGVTWWDNSDNPGETKQN